MTRTKSNIIVRYPNRSDILQVGHVIPMSDGTILVENWVLGGGDAAIKKVIPFISGDKLGGWSVEELQGIIQEYRRGSISG